jgi:xanthine dehydrogenase YagS FAD-binding subunit
MKPFAYERADDVAGAVASASAPGAMFLAGGTNLVDLMKLGVAQPTRLIDISRLPLAEVEELPDGGLRIGATVRNADLAAHAAVRERYPVLAQALLAGASGQIRNVATIGGNLLQRTRCAYFQDVSKSCNKRLPGSGCPAREGEHHNLAILGHSESCVATHPSDMAVALVALDARVDIEGRDGRRTIPLRDLYRLPDGDAERDTILDRGELITAVVLDSLPAAVKSRYRKVRERASFAFALVSVAVTVELADGAIRACGIALGGVAHVPWRASRAEGALRGEPATADNFAYAADLELAEAQPLRDNAYKRTLARNLLIRTLVELCA